MRSWVAALVLNVGSIWRAAFQQTAAMSRSRPSQARPLRVSRTKSREGIAARISRNFLAFTERGQDQEGSTLMGVDRSYHGIGVNSGRSSSEYVRATAFEFPAPSPLAARVGVAAVDIMQLSGTSQSVAVRAEMELQREGLRRVALAQGDRVSMEEWRQEFIYLGNGEIFGLALPNCRRNERF